MPNYNDRNNNMGRGRSSSDMSNDRNFMKSENSGRTQNRSTRGDSNSEGQPYLGQEHPNNETRSRSQYDNDNAGSGYGLGYGGYQPSSSYGSSFTDNQYDNNFRNFDGPSRAHRPMRDFDKNSSYRNDRADYYRGDTRSSREDERELYHRPTHGADYGGAGRMSNYSNDDWVDRGAGTNVGLGIGLDQRNSMNTGANNYRGDTWSNSRWGSVDYAGRGPKGYKRSDDRIKEDVSEALARHSAVDASEIEVEVKDGIVTLKGSVEDRRTKRMAEDAIDHINGVQDIRNELSINQSLFERAKEFLTGESGSKDKPKSSRH